jgi:biopolymer transport protein ExbB/biopolymer transport protein TolQ
MEVRKMRQIAQVACAGLGMVALGTPAFAQGAGGLNLIDIAQNMSGIAIAVAVVLFIMSFWSVGVAIERIYTYNQARKQSKLYAPQVAKHLKDGRLQEYQFQQETGGSSLNREDVLDTVRRSIQRATALTASDLKKGVSTLATIGSTAPFVGLLGTVVGVINAFVGIASTGSGGIGAVSAGIAEALIETALGLFVAIPAVWFYNFLTSRIEYFNVEMDNSSSELVDYFIKKTA